MRAENVNIASSRNGVLYAWYWHEVTREKRGKKWNSTKKKDENGEGLSKATTSVSRVFERRISSSRLLFFKYTPFQFKFLRCLTKWLREKLTFQRDYYNIQVPAPDRPIMRLPSSWSPAGLGRRPDRVPDRGTSSVAWYPRTCEIRIDLDKSSRVCFVSRVTFPRQCSIFLSVPVTTFGFARSDLPFESSLPKGGNDLSSNFLVEGTTSTESLHVREKPQAPGKQARPQFYISFYIPITPPQLPDIPLHPSDVQLSSDESRTFIGCIT